MTDMLSLFFTCLNFAILVCVLGYGIYTYLLPALRISFKHKKEEEKKLQISVAIAHKEKQKLQQVIVGQEHYAKQLQETVERWKSVIEEKRIVQDAEHKERNARAVVCAQERATLRINLKEQKNIMRIALQDARTALKDTFAGHDKVHAYTRELLKTFQRNS